MRTRNIKQVSRVPRLIQQGRRACKGAGQGSGGKQQSRSTGEQAGQGKSEVQAGQQSKGAGQGMQGRKQGRAARQQGRAAIEIQLANGRRGANICQKIL